MGRVIPGKFFVIFLVGTFCASWVALSIERQLGAPNWAFYAIALITGLVLYATGAILTQSYISKRVGFDSGTAFGDTQAWELTAGTGVVPKWVSWIGIFGMCFLLAIPFQLVAWMVR